MVIGYLDGVEGDNVAGWAKHEGSNTAVTVALFIDGVLTEVQIANVYREGLRAATKGSGFHGFVFRLPDAWMDGRMHRVAVAVHGTGYELPPTKSALVTFRRGIGDEETALFNARVDGLLACSIKKLGARPVGTGPVALYACHNSTGSLSASQRNMLEALAAEGFRTIICQSTLERVEEFAESARPLCSAMLFRSDFGRDFASWLILVREFQANILDQDFSVFVNDSFIGPFASLKPIFDAYRAAPVDFFALTESWDIAHHYQTSFFILSKRALLSQEFAEFSFSYEFQSEKLAIIRGGEVELSRCLFRSLLTRRVLIPYEDIAGLWLAHLPQRIEELMKYPEAALAHGATYSDRQFQALRRGHVDFAVEWLLNVASAIRESRPLNPQHVFWREIMLDFDVPFIKRELVFSNPANVPGIGEASRLVQARFGIDGALILSNDFRVLGSSNTPPMTCAPRRLAAE